MDRRTLLFGGAAAAGGLLMSPVGGATPMTPGDYRVLTARYRKAMATGGPSRQLKPIRRLTSTLADHVQEASWQRERIEYAAALGGAAVLHARAASDAGHTGEARAAALTILTAGGNADDADLTALGWAHMAMTSLSSHRPLDDAIGSAMRTQLGSPVVGAWGQCLMADAYSRRGDAYAALSGLDRADALLEHAGSSRWWGFTKAHLDNYRGIVLVRAGHAVEAESMLQDALGRYPSGDNQRLHTMNDLVETYAVLGEPEEAAAYGREVLDMALVQRSAARLNKLTDLMPKLDRWRTVPEVAELRWSLDRARHTLV